MESVFTAPLAIIRAYGVAIGKMRGINVSENIQRGRVQGLGNLVADEVPATSWGGIVTCDFYMIDFKRSQIPLAITREVQSIEQFEDNLTLQSEGVSLHIYQKVPQAGQAGIGLILSEEKVFAVIDGLFIDGQSFNISEGQIAGTNSSFTFIKPIIYPK